MPEPISELIGRDDVLGEILSLAAAHRLVTLTGAGGIGKAQLAIAAARLLLPQFADGVWLAEFSPIADPGLVSVTVAAPIGLDLGGGAVTARRVSQALAGRRLHPAGAQRSLGQRRGSADHVLARVQHQQPIQPISELLEVEGIIDVVGPLPAELQSPDLVYVVGAPYVSEQPIAAKALIDFLADPKAAAVYKAKRLQPG